MVVVREKALWHPGAGTALDPAITMGRATVWAAARDRAVVQ